MADFDEPSSIKHYSHVISQSQKNSFTNQSSPYGFTLNKAAVPKVSGQLHQSLNLA